MLSIESRAFYPKEVSTLLESQALFQGDREPPPPSRFILSSPPVMKAAFSTAKGIWKEKEERKTPLILIYFASSFLRATNTGISRTWNNCLITCLPCTCWDQLWIFLNYTK